MTRTIEIGKNTYTFENESFSNSRNWGHKTRLYLNGILISENKSIYLNRTWESYQYQSCMQGAVHNYLDRELEFAIRSYKEANGIKRLTHERKQEVQKAFNKEYGDLQVLLHEL
jgi:hypothetical protein